VRARRRPRRRAAAPRLAPGGRRRGHRGCAAGPGADPWPRPGRASLRGRLTRPPRQVTYAKAAPDDVCIVVTATNHGPEPAPLHLLPQVWFRNTWSWGGDTRRPVLNRLAASAVAAEHGYLGRYVLAAEGSPEVLFCDNETNAVALFGAERNASRYPKDGINCRVVRGETDAVNPAGTGTKAAFWYR
jgi:hypothetical protein